MTSWTPGWGAFPAALLDFLTERRLATLTTLRRDGTPHVVPVGVTVDHDERCAWVITDAASAKARHLVEPRAVALCQVDGARWATIEGVGQALDDVAAVTRAVECYTERYRAPRENPTRVAIRVEIHRILCSGGLLD